MKRIIKCRHCGCSFECEPHTPSCFIFCPECVKIASEESEYGFGTCYPAGFYFGYRKIGELSLVNEDGNKRYVLNRVGEEPITCQGKTFPTLTKECIGILKTWLNGEE